MLTLSTLPTTPRQLPVKLWIALEISVLVADKSWTSTPLRSKGTTQTL